MAIPQTPTDPPGNNSIDQHVVTRAMLRSCTRIAVFACDRSFKLLQCNVATERLFRLDSSLCDNKRVTDLLADRPGETENISAVCDASVVQGYAEVVVHPPADRSMSMLLTVMPLIDDDGGHIGFLFHGMDITTRRRAEEMLLHYQRAVEASGDLIAAVDRDGVFVLANRMFLGSNNLTRDEVIGRTIGDVYPDRETRQSIKDSLERCFRGEEIRYEKSRSESDGNTFSFRVSYYPLKGSNADIRGAVMVAEDITDRKEAERRIQKALTEKETLIESLTAALDEVKTLRGFIPICAHCKKIRDDQGYWSQIEDYISAHSHAEFSHGICPDCMEQYFPEFKSPEAVDDESPKEC